MVRESKVETYKNLAIFWQAAGTHCQKYGKSPLYESHWIVFFVAK